VGGLSSTLTSALDAGEWSASRLDHFTPSKKVPCTHWTESWVCPRAGLDLWEKRKCLAPAAVRTPDRSVLVKISTTLSQINNMNILSTHLAYFHLLLDSGNTEAGLTQFLHWWRVPKIGMSYIYDQKLWKSAKCASKVWRGDNYASQKNVCKWNVSFKRRIMGVLLMHIPGDHRLQ
jgi:hypothetical protein